MNDPSTWDTFDEALNAFHEGGYSGIGFVFTGTPYIGLDVDGCLNPETGEVTLEAQDAVLRLASYTERSQSGKGLHVICRGKLPPGRRRNGAFEMYADGSSRYFCMTGDVPGQVVPIRECQAEIDHIHREYIQPKKPVMAISQTSPGDSELIVTAQRAKNGAAFTALWGGDTSMHNGGDSAADMALCNMLAFWTGRDAARMDRLTSNKTFSQWNDIFADVTIASAILDRVLHHCTVIHIKDESNRLKERKEYMKQKVQANNTLFEKANP